MDVDAFKQFLSPTGGAYERLSAIPAQQALIRFIGHFEHQPVIWQATVQTLAFAASLQGVEALQSFIDIDGHTDNARLIRVGLPVSVVDEAVLRNTVLMVRRYKNLRPGRHDYGECHHFN